MTNFHPVLRALEERLADDSRVQALPHEEQMAVRASAMSPIVDATVAEVAGMRERGTTRALLLTTTAQGVL